MKPRRTEAFTLLELLVVIGLVAVLSFFMVSGLLGGGATAALQSGQATFANLIMTARIKAPATGRKTRILVNTDPAAPERYLRFLVLQSARQPGSSPTVWDTVTTVTMPEGVYIMPATLTLATGLVSNSAEWKRVSDPTADLVSDLFTGQSIPVTLEGESTAQNWQGLSFTANSTLGPLISGTPKGCVVIALGARRPPGSYLAGESPVQLANPQAVRGLVLSAYGVPALLNERSAF